MCPAWVNVVFLPSNGEFPGQKLIFLLRPPSGPTLCRENVLTQNVASSMVSRSVTWMKP